MTVHVLAACFIVDLSDLGGTGKIEKLGESAHALIGFEGIEAKTACRFAIAGIT
jgi:hypothetical protein